MLSKLQPVKSLNCFIGKVYAKMLITTMMIVAFVLPISGAVGLVSYLSYHNRHEAVKKVAIKLENENCDRIAQYLGNYLTTSKQMNQIKWYVNLLLAKEANYIT